jgi:hypothetical protein
MREKITRILKPLIKVKVYHVVCGERRGTDERMSLRVRRKQYNKLRTYPESSWGNWMCMSAVGKREEKKRRG